MPDRYQKALKQDGRNLSKLAHEGKIRAPSFRQAEIEKILESVAASRSILLVGEQGVGKSCVIHGVAKALRDNNRHLWELSSVAVLTGTRYLGDWQSKAEAIIQALKPKNSLLYFSDVWNLPTVGASSNDPSSLLDFLRPLLQSGSLQIMGEITPDKLQDIQKTPQFSALFDIIQIGSLSKEQIASIVINSAAEQDIAISKEAISQALQLCERFLPSDNGPGQALRLLQQVGDYHRAKVQISEPEPVDSLFVEKVFSIYSGLPRFVVSRTTNIPSREIHQWFQEQVIGQEQAIDAVVEMITLFKAGLHDPNRPIGTFLFVGPTGVGKTELAKSLAKFLFGSETRLLRFDLSEFKDFHAFQMLVGDPEKPRNPARLLDPVRSQPFQVILFDEFEKGHRNIWDTLLQLLDEGHVSPPQGKKVNFRNTIVIATSNAGAQESQKHPMGFNTPTNSAISIKSLENVFRPELLNRFQHIVSFNSLNKDHVRLIAKKEIKQVITREGIASRDLAVEVSSDLLESLIEKGYDNAYGARALKRQIQQSIVLPIASKLMEVEIIAGSILKLEDNNGRTKVRILDSDDSRDIKRKRTQKKSTSEKSKTLQELKEFSKSSSGRVDQLIRWSQTLGLDDRLQKLDLERASPKFWQQIQQANKTLLEIDSVKLILNRVDLLITENDDIAQELNRKPDNHYRGVLNQRLLKHGQQISEASRELMHLGDSGNWDALIAIAPLTASIDLRNLLFETYHNWAKWRGLEMKLIHDPLEAEETIFFALKGPYAFGYLENEKGVHRSREGERHEAVRVSIAAWSEPAADVHFKSQWALKKMGTFGKKIRSRVAVDSKHELVLQNTLTITENRDLAREIAPSWALCKSSDDVVRRYDKEPFLLKDYVTQISSGKQSILKPQEFHTLLCDRIDKLGSDRKG